VAAAVSLLLPGFLTPVRGQETVRMSMASAEAAEARHRAASSIGYYDLKLGPTAWNFGTGLGLEYNSNVYNTESNPSGDFIFRPQINTRMLWPISDRNSINLSLGGGYSAYASNQRLDRAFITPDSELSFDLYVGEFWINLHDRFSISEDSFVIRAEFTSARVARASLDSLYQRQVRVFGLVFNSTRPSTEDYYYYRYKSYYKQYPDKAESNKAMAEKTG
jgi:hypothetical protein